MDEQKNNVDWDALNFQPMTLLGFSTEGDPIGVKERIVKALENHFGKDAIDSSKENGSYLIVNCLIDNLLVASIAAEELQRMLQK